MSPTYQKVSYFTNSKRKISYLTQAIFEQLATEIFLHLTEIFNYIAKSKTVPKCRVIRYRAEDICFISLAPRTIVEIRKKTGEYQGIHIAIRDVQKTDSFAYVCIYLGIDTI